MMGTPRNLILGSIRGSAVEGASLVSLESGGIVLSDRRMHQSVKGNNKIKRQPTVNGAIMLEKFSESLKQKVEHAQRVLSSEQAKDLSKNSKLRSPPGGAP